MKACTGGHNKGWGNLAWRAVVLGERRWTSKMLLLSIHIALLLRRRPSRHAHSHPRDTVTWIAPCITAWIC